jgi:hypothetical protein
MLKPTLPLSQTHESANQVSLGVMLMNLGFSVGVCATRCMVGSTSAASTKNVDLPTVVTGWSGVVTAVAVLWPCREIKRKRTLEQACGKRGRACRCWLGGDDGVAGACLGDPRGGDGNWLRGGWGHGLARRILGPGHIDDLDM